MEGAEARIKPAGDGGVTLGANALSDPTAGDHIVGMKLGANAASTDALSSTNFSLALDDTKPATPQRVEPARGNQEQLFMPRDLADTYDRIMNNITSGQQGQMPNNDTSQPVEVKEDVPMS